MKKIRMIAYFTAIALSMQGCYMTTVDSGETGVKVVNGKVEKDPVKPGFHMSINPLAELDIYNTKMRALMLNSKEARHAHSNSDIIYSRSLIILTKESMEVPLDMTLNYRVNGMCAPSIRKNFGPDITWDKKIVIPRVRSISRGVIGTATVYDLNEKRELYASKIKSELNKSFDSIFGPSCVTVSTVSIQNIYLPEALKKSIMLKQQMNQEVARKQLEIKKTQAEAQQRIAKERGQAESVRIAAKGAADAQMIRAKAAAKAKLIEAEAIAKSNKMISESLNPAVLKYQEIMRWNGVKPRVLLGDDSKALVNVKGGEK